MGLFVFWRYSIGQLVHHSVDLKLLFKRCQDECDDGAVSTKFGNLRAAKHRLESEMTPLSRAVVNLSALMLFAVGLSELKRGEHEGQAADTFLTTSTPTVFLIMAGAGVEALDFIRALDTERLPVSDVHDLVRDFLDRITWLFHNDGCLHIPGRTACVIEWLKTPHYYFVIVRNEHLTVTL